jgi:hypothetical protein
MGILDKLKGMLGGSGGGSGGTGDSGLYFYVKLKRGGEIVRLRIEPQYELVPDYDNGGYVTRKTIVGPLTYQRAEATFRFDENRSLADYDISGGELVDKAAWDAQEAARKDTAP